MTLERRTPLSRGSGGLSRGAPLPRSSTLKPRSAARERAYAGPNGRRALVARLLAERPVCEVQWACHGARAQDVHERLKRSRGGNILDPVQAHMVTACRPCHDLTEREPAEATFRRMLLPSHHRCPEVGPC